MLARVRGCVVLVLILHTVVYYFKGTHEYVSVCFIVVFFYVRHLERIYAFAPYKHHSDWLITITSSKMKMQERQLFLNKAKLKIGTQLGPRNQTGHPAHRHKRFKQVPASVTTRITSALGWAAMRAILMFHNFEGQSHKTVSTDHNF